MNLLAGIASIDTSGKQQKLIGTINDGTLVNSIRRTIESFIAHHIFRFLFFWGEGRGGILADCAGRGGFLPDRLFYCTSSHR